MEDGGIRNRTHYTDYQSSISATPINSRSAGYDTDNDGMPDIWESATFGDLAKDGTGDDDLDGYTDLEEYLNLVDNVVPSPPTISIKKASLGAGKSVMVGGSNAEIYVTQ